MSAWKSRWSWVRLVNTATAKRIPSTRPRRARARRPPSRRPRPPPSSHAAEGALQVDRLRRRALDRLLDAADDPLDGAEQAASGRPARSRISRIRKARRRLAVGAGDPGDAQLGGRVAVEARRRAAPSPRARRRPATCGTAQLERPLDDQGRGAGLRRLPARSRGRRPCMPGTQKNRAPGSTRRLSKARPVISIAGVAGDLDHVRPRSSRAQHRRELHTRTRRAEVAGCRRLLLGRAECRGRAARTWRSRRRRARRRCRRSSRPSGRRRRPRPAAAGPRPARSRRTRRRTGCPSRSPSIDLLRGAGLAGEHVAGHARPPRPCRPARARPRASCAARAAFFSLITRSPAGPRRLRSPSLVEHQLRRAQDAAVGDRRVGGGHLHRRHREALADRQVAHRRAGVVVGRRERCPAPRPGTRCRSAGRSRSGGSSGRSDRRTGIAELSLSSRPIVTAPTLEEYVRISATDERAVAARRATRSIVRSATWIVGPSGEGRARA